jgi:hypothetical protein
MQENRTDPVMDMEMMQRKAKRRARRRTSMWLNVLLPFVVGTLAIAALVAWAWLGGTGDASAWADTSLTILLLPFLLLCLLPFILLLALSYGLGRLLGWLPEPLDKIDHALGRVERGTERVTEAAVQPLIHVKAFLAAVAAGWAKLGEIVRGERGVNDE